MIAVRCAGQRRTTKGLCVSADDGRQLLLQLCEDLRLLRLRAGGPSLRSLAARLRLGKSQIGSILNGKIGQLPDWDVVRGIVDACRQYAQDQGRLDQLSLATGIEQFWRPRYTMVDYALQQAPRQRSAPTAPADPVRTVRGDAPQAAVPRQLPAATPHFAGRIAELAELDGLLDDAATTNAVIIWAIAGTAGVGKTALAVHWAHRVADRFPDGQLYINLRGFDPGRRAMAPTEAVYAVAGRTRCPAGPDPTEPRRRRPRCTAACWPAGGCSCSWTTPATPTRSARCCRVPAAPRRGDQPQPARRPGRGRRRPPAEPRRVVARDARDLLGKRLGANASRPSPRRWSRSSRPPPGCHWR